MSDQTVIKVDETTYLRLDSILSVERISDAAEGVILTLVGGTTKRVDYVNSTVADLKYLEFVGLYNSYYTTVDAFSPSGGWI